VVLPTYTVVILKKGPTFNRETDGPLIWEHGRRNFSLRADGKLVIVCPVDDGSDVAGVGIFDLSPEETIETMNGDPGVRAGTFLFEIHECRSFPGDRLPS
jgi:hypothetical protein